MKNIWYNIIDLGYSNNPLTPWEEKQVIVTIGENNVHSVFEIITGLKVEDYIKKSESCDSGFQIRLGFDDLTVYETTLYGFCGELKIVKSSNRDEFKIEFK